MAHALCFVQSEAERLLGVLTERLSEGESFGVRKGAAFGLAGSYMLTFAFCCVLLLTLWCLCLLLVGVGVVQPLSRV